MSCIFCEIVNGKIPCTKVYEDSQVLAFKDINPAAPIHFLVIPKEHAPNVMEIEPKNLISVFDAIKKLVEDYDLQKKGFRIVNNTGEDAGQTVEHVHFHLLAGKKF